MSTVIRPELSRQNKYHIDRHDKFREELTQQIKDVGQELIDKAERIVPEDLKFVRGISSVSMKTVISRLEEHLLLSPVRSRMFVFQNAKALVLSTPKPVR